MKSYLSKKLGTTEPIRILPVGDSITRGLTNAGSIPGGYRTRLHQRLKNEVFVAQGVRFVGTQNDNPDPENLPDPEHEGRGGFRIDEHMPTIADAILANRPDFVLLHLGTNDIDQNRDMANAPSRLNYLIGQMVAASPQIHIVVAQICNAATQNASKIPTILAYNKAIQQIVAARQSSGKLVTTIDMFNVVSPENFADTTYHPNKSGYDEMADAWMEAIAALANSEGTQN